MGKLRLILGGKAEPLPQAKEFKTETILSADIQEERVFNKGEILGLVRQLARAEGIPSHALTIQSEVYDAEGNLVYLTVQATQKEARKFGWGSIVFYYMIKGTHPGVGSTCSSYIPRIYSSVAYPLDSCAGGIVAEYKDDAWILSPGEVCPSVEIQKDTLEKIDETVPVLQLLPQPTPESALPDSGT